MTKEDFLKLVETKWGKKMADLIVEVGFDEYARKMLGTTLEGEIRQLEGK